MARWRLITPHYLNVPGIESEYKETDQQTGRQKRVTYPVPLLLDPASSPDWNYPGEIIVCHEGKGQHRDIVFIGDPTLDMEPLDDEAKALSSALEAKRQHPIESLPGQGFGEVLLDKLSRQLDQLVRTNGIPSATQNASVANSVEFEMLKQQVQMLMQQNEMLIAKLSGVSPVVDDVEPLPPTPTAEEAAQTERRV